MTSSEVAAIESDDRLWYVYAASYASLVRMAALLSGSPTAAEDVVQEAFIRLAARSRPLREPDETLAYVRRSVVNQIRSDWRRRMTAQRHQPRLAASAGDASDTSERAFAKLDVVRALRRLSRRQREVLVLRYYLDLPEREIALTLGISEGSVKSYASRGLHALREGLGSEWTPEPGG